MVWMAVGTVLFLGVIAVWMPRFSRADIPLGVNVPSDRVCDPVVAAAVRRYRMWVAALTVVLVALLVGVGARRLDDRAMSTVMLGAIFAMLAGIAALTRLASQPIRDAKRREGWYAGKRVAVIAPLDGEPDPAAHVRWGWHAAAVAVALAFGAYAVGAYDRLPDPLPVHSDLTTINRWEPKTPGAVATPVLIDLVLVVMIALVAWVIARQAPRVLPGGDPAGAAAARSRRASSTQQVVGVVNLVCAVVMAASSLVMWNDAMAWQPAVLALGLGAPLVVLVVWTARLSRATGRDGTGVRTAGVGPSGNAGAEPESPDDDAHWKWGMFYVNRDDPRLMVEKRLGYGLTINLGHPVGMALAVVALVAVVAAVVAPLLTR